MVRILHTYGYKDFVTFPKRYHVANYGGGHTEETLPRQRPQRSTKGWKAMEWQPMQQHLVSVSLREDIDSTAAAGSPASSAA